MVLANSVWPPFGATLRADSNVAFGGGIFEIKPSMCQKNVP